MNHLHTSLISSVLSGLLDDSVFAFLDDVIVVFKDAESNLQKLEEILTRIKSVGLTLKLSKCNFFKKQITYLGHVLDSEGLLTTPEKVKAVQNFPKPTDIKSLRSFLGFSGYYRSLIPHHSTVAKGLNQPLHKGTVFTWGDAQESDFIHLKTLLTQKTTH